MTWSGTVAKHASADRTRTTRRDQASDASARKTSPHVSYQGHTMGPRKTTTSRLQPSALGVPKRSVRSTRTQTMTAATAKATARAPTTRAWVGALPPTPSTTWAMASPTAVAGASHEFTFPGSERFQTQPRPSPDTSETPAITASATAIDPATRPRRLGAEAWDPAHSQPM